ncbi:MAG TPA: tRNA lysidine(34) synthetase TilS, partial [Acidimicrobiales bacterium]|nr:tRNA lysidine(34) synthetase TilS [Acidimicrobiales bacterium]
MAEPANGEPASGEPANGRPANGQPASGERTFEEGALAEATGPLLGRCTFPPPGTRLICAVSGGPDSTALMVLAVAAGCRVTAVHVDHGLRPGSASEAGVVADCAQRLGAGFRAERVMVAPGPNLEARARAARRAILGPEAATGHTADDQAETVLLNLLRGAGVDGLSAMHAGPRHPILALRRRETVELCSRLGIETVSDPSNRDPRHRRNRVRHELLPLCSDIAGRDVVPVLARQAALMAGDSEVLCALAQLLDPTDARALQAGPEPVARRALRRWLTGSGPYPPDADAVERVLEVARGRQRATEVAGGRRVTRSAGRLSVGPAAL